MNKIIHEVELFGIKSKGKTHLIRHLSGERLTQRQAILAKCCECTGYHADGRSDCGIPECPLYPYMPYAKNKSVETVSADEDA